MTKRNSTDAALINQQEKRALDFIKKARKVHGDEYDYSQVDYINSKTKVRIICKTHGNFWQVPSDHTSHKNKCPSCSSTQKTNKDFIRDAVKRHGSKYDYAKTEYTDSKTKVIVTCPKHGDFDQVPAEHIRKKSIGCSKCRKEELQQARQEAFISAAQEAHKGKYDYSKVKYRTATTKVDIICSVHGVFRQRPADHNAKAGPHGCPKCANLLTLGDFKERATETHGGRYDYSKSEYLGLSEKVIITCKKHGDFKQLPSIHIYQKSDCPKCAMESKTTGHDGFIALAKEVHGDRYDYSKTVFKKFSCKVVITCPEHGDFEKWPAAHIKQKNPCPTCYARSRAKTQGDFIKEARVIHKGLYSYENTVYINMMTKIAITCDIHGDFLQKPADHLVNKQGCPTCAREIGLWSRTDYVRHTQRYSDGTAIMYVTHCRNKDLDDNEDFYKVGITSGTVEARFSKGIPYNFESLYEVKGEAGYIYDLEKRLHRILIASKAKYKPKLTFGGETECFTTIKPIEQLLKKLSSTEQLQLIA